MKIIILISLFSALFFMGCGEEASSIKKNTTSTLPKQIKTEIDTLQPLLEQPIVEKKQVLKNEIPKEEPLENFAAPKSEEELADEQSTITEEIIEEIHEGPLPAKSEEELLSEDPDAILNTTYKKSAEELADEN